MSPIPLELPFAEKLKKNADSNNIRKSLHKPSRNQIQFQITCLEDLIPEDHRARDVWEFVCQMDFSKFLDEIKLPEGCGGPRTKDPRVLMALWLYATLENIHSARQIDRLCREHHAYIWICGGLPMNYHSLADFRTCGADKFRVLLQESIALIWQSGLWQPDTVAQDGTKVKANASKGLFRRKAKLDEYLEEANAHITRLENELKTNPGAFSIREKAAKLRAAQERKERVEKAQAEYKKYVRERIASGKASHNSFTKKDQENLRISLTDPEARRMKMPDRGTQAAYNVQFATTTDKKVIVAVEVVNTNDYGTLAPMMQQVTATFEKIGCQILKDWLCDSGYANKKDAAEAAKAFPHITFYSPPVANGKYDALTPRETDNEAMMNLRKRMGTEEAQVKYKKRCCTAEFANASTKNLGMREFWVRGLEKVKQTALLYAITHNMMMFFKYCQ